MNGSEPKPAVSPVDFMELMERYEILWSYKLLRDLFPRLNVDCVWDVGANVGQWAGMLRAHGGYPGPIVSFEPVSKVQDQLRELASKREPWKVIQVALGSHDEERPIKVYEHSGLSSFLHANEYGAQTFGKFTNVAAEEVVPVRTLDSLASEIAEPESRVFLKLDTQGWDIEVLRGAEECLSQVVGIQIELPLQPIYEGMPHYTEVLSHLESKGFAISGQFPVNRDSKLRLVEFDCVLVRPEAVSAPGQPQPAATGRDS